MQRVPKSLKAVLFPREFEAFARVPDAQAFESLWRSNRPAVLANMSHAAYFEAPRIEALMHRLGAADARCFGRTEPEAFLAAWPDKAVLAFRGTSGAGDVLTDLNVFKDRRVHAGFQRKLETMWHEQIRPRLEELDEPVRPHVWATGHSLGGAMAMLAGLLWPFEEVVTFGAPRVGAGIGSAFLAGQVVRYVNGADKVPDMPPEALGYEHHGELVTLVDPNGPSLRYDHAIVYYAEILEM